MLTMRRAGLFAPLFVLLSGCTGGIDYDHFADTLIDARCTYYVRCGVAASGTECTAFYQRVAADNPSTNAAIDAGKILYHADVAQDCLDAYAALSCDTTQQPVDALDICNGVLTGTVAAGGACAFDKECASQSCDVPSCPDACCTGTCGPPSSLPTVGQPCTAFCAGDAYCGADSICHAPLAQGAACTTEPCANGLYCAGRTSTNPGRCEPLPHLGQPCEGACAEIGATCAGGFCVEIGVSGDACTSDAGCSMFYQCNGTACALLPTLGMPCRTSCYEAAYCDGTTCVAQKPNGATCLRSDECQSHYCDSEQVAGTCADVPVCF
jgi:hypothetical protein